MALKFTGGKAEGVRGVRRTESASGTFSWFTQNKAEAESIRDKMRAAGLQVTVLPSAQRDGTNYYIQAPASAIGKYLDNLFIP